MTAAASPSTGQATLRLHVADGRVVRADVAVDRPATAARKLLLGKTPDEALKLVPLLFAVCGVSQAYAAAQACEQALGVEAAATQQTARRMLATADALNGHCRFIALDWPSHVGENPPVEEYAKLRKALARLAPALYPNRDAFALGGGWLRPDLRAVSAAINDAMDALDLILDTPDQVCAGLSSCINGAAPRLLPARDAAWFAARLAERPGFDERPDDDGETALNAPLALCVEHRGVASLLARCGLSATPLYMARCAAAMSALKLIVAGLKSLVAEMEETGPINGAPSQQPRRADGVGCGVALAARGQLAHWVRIVDGRVADWRAVAPTEWNFHPDGPLARALIGATADADLTIQAERLVCALDPCVPWRVEVIEPDQRREPGHA
jgi:uptake hydrogenase large subunit